MKNKKGISLIALIITIIVIVLLAAIVIPIAVKAPENAKMAKLANDIGEMDDRVKLAYMSKQTTLSFENDTADDSAVYNWIATGNLENTASDPTINEESNNIETKLPEYPGSVWKIDIDTGEVYLSPPVTIGGTAYAKRTDFTGEAGEQGSDLVQVIDPNPGVLEGNGSEDDPYLIQSIEDLLAFGEARLDYNYNGGHYEYVKLVNTLDFRSRLSYVNPDDTTWDADLDDIEEALIDETNKLPYAIVGYFYGEFDGNGKEIRNMRLGTEENNVPEPIYALFGNVYGVIKNLGVTGEISIGDSSLARKDNTLETIKGVLGFNTTYAVSSDNIYYLAGIAKYLSGEISNCYSDVDFKLYNTTGPIDYRIGGIVEQTAAGNNAIIKNCYYMGSMTENNMNGIVEAGGIVNWLNGATVEKCYNKGNILLTSGNSSIGGMCGQCYYDSSINNCYNLGNVTIGEGIVGGICGDIYWYEGNTLSISNVYNKGIISNGGGDNPIGNIVGLQGRESENIYVNCFYQADGTTNMGVNGADIINRVSSKPAGEMPTVLSIINGENAFKEVAGTIRLSWQ